MQSFGVSDCTSFHFLECGMKRYFTALIFLLTLCLQCSKNNEQKKLRNTSSNVRNNAFRRISFRREPITFNSFGCRFALWLR